MKVSMELDAVDQLVQSTIEIGLAEALTRNSDKVITEIVRQAISEPQPTTSKTAYGSGSKSLESPIRSAIAAGVRDIAKRKVAEWLDSHDKEIQELVALEVNRILRAELVVDAVNYAIGEMKGTLRLHPSAVKAARDSAKAINVDLDEDDYGR